MRSLRLILTAIIIVGGITSCSMIEWDDIVSADIGPTLIKKSPVFRGGNVDCTQLDFLGYKVMTTARNDYNPKTDSFANGWPTGLLVKVYDGKSVSFQIDGSINLGDGKCYKVGAVIVKGGDASNIYNYSDLGGVTMDRGLVAPNNASGRPAGLSNLTFCLIEIECEEKPEFLIALKVRYDNQEYAMMDGDEFPFAGSCEWGNTLGVSIYNGNRILNLFKHESEIAEIVGKATFSDNGKTLTVIIEMANEASLNDAYLYAGNRNYLTNKITATGCPAYWGWPFVKSEIGSKVYTFEIDFDDIPLDW